MSELLGLLGWLIAAVLILCLMILLTRMSNIRAKFKDLVSAMERKAAAEETVALMEEALRAAPAISGNLAPLRFQPSEVEQAIAAAYAEIDKRAEPFRSNPLVQEMTGKMKAQVEELIRTTAREMLAKETSIEKAVTVEIGPPWKTLRERGERLGLPQLGAEENDSPHNQPMNPG
jgi:hypothetical protein